jgi:hypothetical protein
MLESDFLLDKLFNYGIAGIMLCWFMLRIEKVINNNTKILEKVESKL